jgi:hypothetical protein
MNMEALVLSMVKWLASATEKKAAIFRNQRLLPFILVRIINECAYANSSTL